MFPVSDLAFDDPARFEQGFEALLLGLGSCATAPTIFCSSQPRATYNNITFFAYAFDYFIKQGDEDQAMNMLGAGSDPQYRYDTWYLGQAAWERRVEHVDEIAARYANGNSEDDPLSIVQKRHAWGPVSSTCQLCHQVQGATWTDAEKASAKQLDPALLSIGDWPAYRVDWDGSIQP
jgi:hypothetical protein